MQNLQLAIYKIQCAQQQVKAIATQTHQSVDANENERKKKLLVCCECVHIAAFVMRKSVDVCGMFNGCSNIAYIRRHTITYIRHKHVKIFLLFVYVLPTNAKIMSEYESFVILFDTHILIHTKNCI